jgi:tRNA threonylcarbamoyladenosine biosynthesis protein TsaB
MNVLAFDTATDACSAAVLIDGEIAARRFEVLGRGHVERLVAMVDEVMAAAVIGFGELDLIAVTVGPGTFTGVRIGLAAARGFGLAASLPVAGFTTLEVLAGGADRTRRPGAGVIAAMDARRGQIYRQTFDADLAALDEPAAADRDGLEVRPGKWLVVGTGAGAYAGIAGVETGTGPELPDAAVLALLAEQRYGAGAAPLPAHPPDPLYLRPPDADLPAVRT